MWLPGLIVGIVIGAVGGGGGVFIGAILGGLPDGCFRKREKRQSTSCSL